MRKNCENLRTSSLPALRPGPRYRPVCNLFFIQFQVICLFCIDSSVPFQKNSGQLLFFIGTSEALTSINRCSSHKNAKYFILTTNILIGVWPGKLRKQFDRKLACTYLLSRVGNRKKNLDERSSIELIAPISRFAYLDL